MKEILLAIKEWVLEIVEGIAVTPEMFGAKGDGVTDDTIAFIKAFSSSKHVKCNPNKTYYFENIVDLPDIVDGVLDMRGCTFLNFHIRVGMNANGNPTAYYPARQFIIKNGTLGDYYSKPKDWKIPVIQTGTSIRIEDILLDNTPYLLATVNAYRDRFEFINVNKGGDTTLFKDDELELDAINLIKSDGSFVRFNKTDIANTKSDQQNIAGDGWIIQNVNEFRSRENSDYAFCHFVNNNPVIIKNCIQSRFVFGSNCFAKLIGCHFENHYTMPEIFTLEDATTKSDKYNYSVNVNYDTCYFWHNYQLETDNEKVLYSNCKFRNADMAEAESVTIPLAKVLGDKDYYTMKCKIENSTFGMNSIIDLDRIKGYKNSRKCTRSWKNGTEYEGTLSKTITKNKTLTASTKDCFYPQSGEYKYTGYLFATGSNIANEKYEWTRTIPEAESCSSDRYENIYGLNGGWSFEIYRTLPDKTIQRARYALDPFELNDASISDVYISFIEKGNYLILIHGNVMSDKTSVEENIYLPWITVGSIPIYSVNSKIYEKNGCIVSLDNSRINIPRNSNYIQNDDYVMSKTEMLKILKGE